MTTEKGRSIGMVGERPREAEVNRGTPMDYDAMIDLEAKYSCCIGSRGKMPTADNGRGVTRHYVGRRAR